MEIQDNIKNAFPADAFPKIGCGYTLSSPSLKLWYIKWAMDSLEWSLREWESWLLFSEQ
jgi:hypothetical protein